MNKRKQRAWPRLAPLAAALMAAGSGATAAAPPQPFGASVPQGWVPGDGRGVAALMQALRAASAAARSAGTSGAATTRTVTSCADDGGAGTLRAIIAAANSGDLIELAGLSCSTITLSQGAIPVKVDELTVHGRGADALAIDGAGLDRVFLHYGYDAFVLSGVTVRNGVNRLDGYKVAGGACIISNSLVTLDHSVVSGCAAIGEGAYGGAILSHNLKMYTSTLINNVAQGSLLDTLTASYGGGAFAYRGTFQISDSNVTGNRAIIDPANTHGSYDTGAGLFADNGGTVLGSTFSANVTDGTGAAIASHAGCTIGNSTISGNVAGKAGGGVFVRPVYRVSLYSSTIAHNQARNGGGIYIAGVAQPVTLQGTIVADNVATAGGADIGAQRTLAIGGASNLVLDAAGVTLPADTLHGDPRLQALADNGGPTPTHALGSGSPAIDHGNNAGGFNTDQRGVGFARVRGSAADIGAFESAPAAPAAIAAAPAAGAGALLLLSLLIGTCGLRRCRPAKAFTLRSPPAPHPSQM